VYGGGSRGRCVLGSAYPVRAKMDWYLPSVVLHILAVLFWFGHMFFWSIVVGPITKKIAPPESGQLLRQASLRYGGLGWPALAVLLITGIVMLAYRGATIQQMMSGEFFLTPFGRILRTKFLLVACMMLYQFLIGHRSAPRLIYLNMLAGLVIVGLSILLTRAPTYFGFAWKFF